MFPTSNFSSSGRQVHAVLRYFSTHRISSLVDVRILTLHMLCQWLGGYWLDNSAARLNLLATFSFAIINVDRKLISCPWAEQIQLPAGTQFAVRSYSANQEPPCG
jgi:hypothetical protein